MKKKRKEVVNSEIKVNVKKSAFGVFGDKFEIHEILKEQIIKSENEDHLKAIETVFNDNGVRRPYSAGVGLRMAKKISDEILIKNGIAENVPENAPHVDDLGGFDVRGVLSKSDLKIQQLINNGDQELSSAFELRCSLLGVQYFQKTINPYKKSIFSKESKLIDYGLRHAFRVGQLMALLEIQSKFGELVEQRRKSIKAINNFNKERGVSPKEIKYLESLWNEYWKTATKKRKTVSGAIEWIVEKRTNKRFLRSVNSNKKTPDEKERERLRRIIDKSQKNDGSSFVIPAQNVKNIK